MKYIKTKSFQALIQSFFEQHLAIERNASANTVEAYRDAIKLFLNYASCSKGCTPDQLDHNVLEAKNVRAFLDWLQKKRNCGERTRNHRLAVLEAFARFGHVQLSR